MSPPVSQRISIQHPLWRWGWWLEEQHLTVPGLSYQGHVLPRALARSRSCFVL